jgi:hypothetical protein
VWETAREIGRKRFRAPRSCSVGPELALGAVGQLERERRRLIEFRVVAP